MKRSAVLFLMLSLVISFAYAGGGDDLKTEQDAIKKVIQTAYVDGLQNKGDLDYTRKGFHEGFELLGVYNNNLTKYPIYTWIDYAESAKEDNGDPPSDDEIVSVKFLDVDITGTAAVAKIELHRGGKHIFTDYLSLYKFEEGWRIVSKIYYRIPEEKSE